MFACRFKQLEKDEKEAAKKAKEDARKAESDRKKELERKAEQEKLEKEKLEKKKKEDEKANLILAQKAVVARCEGSRYFVDDPADYSFERETMKVRVNTYTASLTMSKFVKHSVVPSDSLRFRVLLVSRIPSFRLLQWLISR